ncbi:MAG: hypothetical protein KDK07_04650 [Bauldia sp.]|nr:hypothetical protein [Bauldia sp.]
MEGFIAFAMGNFTLTFFVIGLVVSFFVIVESRVPRTGPVVSEAIFKWFLIFSIGVSGVYNAVFHIAFGKMAAEFIGWADSPFQTEVGFASLGMGVLGLIAAWRSFDMRLAAIIAPACFLWGAAGGHIYQMIVANNFAPGNAGIIFWSDVLVPVFGFFFLWLQRRYELEARSVAPYPWFRRPAPIA